MTHAHFDEQAVRMTGLPKHANMTLERRRCCSLSRRCGARVCLTIGVQAISGLGEQLAAQLAIVAATIR